MNLFRFFYDNFPSLSLIAWLFPLSLAYTWLSLTLAGLLKMGAGWRTGLTRKVFHFLVFTFVFTIQYYFSLPGTFIAGWAVTAVLLLALYKGEAYLIYEAIAREQDAPYRSRYIVYSYFATFAGGVLANLLFGPKLALFGYLITGIGDAVAEPVGVLFGKHRYRVFNLHRPVSYRSLEGSAAVLLSTALVVLIAEAFVPGILSLSAIGLIGCAVTVTLLEAVSPQGWDNLVLQVGASFAVGFFLL